MIFLKTSLLYKNLRICIDTHCNAFGHSLGNCRWNKREDKASIIKQGATLTLEGNIVLSSQLQISKCKKPIRNWLVNKQFNY